MAFDKVIGRETLIYGQALMFRDPFSSPDIPTGLNRLPREQARFCLSVARFMEKELGVALSGTRILVALSGGADSTALLLCLHYLAPLKNFVLCAAHLDHALRPSSAREAECCRALCIRLDIPFFTRRIDVAAMGREEKRGIEESARQARYAFFDSLVRDGICDWVAAGHNKNDLAEDVLMRLVRGAGWPGLGGMRAVDGRRRLLRPLLMRPRADIEVFLKGLGLGWLEDESNSDPAYFRNRVRNTLLPLVLEENPAFLDNAAGLWRLARIDEDYFARILPGPYPAPPENGRDSDEKEFFTGIGELACLPQALRLRLYKEALAGLGSGQALLDNLLRLDACLMDAAGGKTRQAVSEHQFPGGKLALVNPAGIVWKKAAGKKEQ